MKRGRHRMHCDFAFFIGGTHDNIDDLPELERLPGCAGVKVFMGSSTGSLLVEDEEGLRDILKVDPPPRLVSCRGRAAAERAQALRVEGDAALASGLARSGGRADRDAAPGAASRTRPARACTCCTSRPRRRSNFSKDHKDVASVEVTPHHLTLEAPDCYERLGTRAQMNPPVRDAVHATAIWRGVQQGVVDMLGSDHAPHTLEEKAKPIRRRRPA